MLFVCQILMPTTSSKHSLEVLGDLALKVMCYLYSMYVNRCQTVTFDNKLFID